MTLDLSSRRGSLASSYPFPFIRLPPSFLYPRSILQSSTSTTTSAEPHPGIAQLWHQLGTMESPTSVPPGIRKIPGTLHNGLGKSVEYIRTIYNTPVRGIRTRKANQCLAPTSPSVAGQPSRSRTSEEGEGLVTMTATSTTRDSEREVLHRLRSDTFKRSYVIRSLTSIVAYISGGSGGRRGRRPGTRASWEAFGV
ncbi:hypothetical protein BKA70DRAFT_709871 [Coprinopsis sp. MPI-PUGE-AT-0042]|nr:hypothetical protein BKA70DRAFT_709871 [Coprinopsis sp. MPI-PUGE-AT-0042]